MVISATLDPQAPELLFRTLRAVASGPSSGPLENTLAAFDCCRFSGPTTLVNTGVHDRHLQLSDQANLEALIQQTSPETTIAPLFGVANCCSRRTAQASLCARAS